MTPKMSNILKSLIAATAVASLVVACGNHNRGFRPKKRKAGVDGLVAGKDTPTQLARAAQDQLARQLVAKALMGRTDADVQDVDLLNRLLPESAASVILGTKASIASAEASPSLAGAGLAVTTPSDTGSNMIQATISSIVGSTSSARAVEGTGQLEPGKSFMDTQVGDVQFKAACYESCKSLLVLVTAGDASAAYMFAISNGVGTIVGSSLGSRLKTYDVAARSANLSSPAAAAAFRPSAAALGSGTQTIMVPDDSAAQPIGNDPLIDKQEKVPPAVEEKDVVSGDDQQGDPEKTVETAPPVGGEDKEKPALVEETSTVDAQIASGKRALPAVPGGDAETNLKILMTTLADPGTQIPADQVENFQAIAAETLLNQFSVDVPVFNFRRREVDGKVELMPAYVVETYGGTVLFSDGEDQQITLNENLLSGKTGGGGFYGLDRENNLILALRFRCKDSCKKIYSIASLLVGKLTDAGGGRSALSSDTKLMGQAVFEFDAVEGSEFMNITYSSGGPSMDPQVIYELAKNTQTMVACMAAAKEKDERTPCVDNAGEDKAAAQLCLSKVSTQLEAVDCSMAYRVSYNKKLRPIIEATQGKAYAEKYFSDSDSIMVKIRKAAMEADKITPVAEAPADDLSEKTDQPAEVVTADGNDKPDQPAEAVTTDGGDEKKDVVIEDDGRPDHAE